MSAKFKRQDGEAVAIIGLAGRFSKAANVAEYWRNLCDGVESLTISTDEQLLDSGVPRELWENPDYVRAGGVVENADHFDAQFFGLNAREAEIVDPQQRVFLECAWEALEDAGHDPSTFAGDIGLYAGAGLNTYSLTNLFPNAELVAQAGTYQIMVGNDKDFLATRVAYKLNLKGPAVGVQTACSTSLVAVQMAFESLLRGECDMALAGGVSILFPQYGGYQYLPGMILSPDGHCRAFDARAAGTVPGRGAGVVVLRRLSDALDDGDQVYAVIRGAAINNDGAAKIGYSAPSVEGQSRVIAKSMAMAGFAPESVSYIEAHGTGTEVGDPIEITALTEVFGGRALQTKSCVIGSVKTNIGHLDTAAGIAGLIKAALAIKHRVIPPTLHFEQANPLIHFDQTPFFVNTNLLRYEKAIPFRAGVSSFGIGGTNAHVSLEEAPAMAARGPAGIGQSLPQLVVLSAKSEAALNAQSAALLAHFNRHPQDSLSDAAFTLQTGRRPFRFRRSFVARDLIDAARILSAAPSPKIHSGQADNETREYVFLFPGQGSQYVNMGRGLYDAAPAFRQTIDACAELLKSDLGLDLRTILFPEVGAEETSKALLRSTEITQPALFTIEYASARLWMDCGIQPAAMLGHSVGEYVAASIAGVFSLKDALHLIARRGKLVQSAEPGAMLAVSLSEPALLPLLESSVSIAAINSSGQTVATGPTEAIVKLEAVLASKSIEHKRLKTSHAFHSAMLDPILDSFHHAFDEVTMHSPALPFLSNLTGDWITAEQATDPAYWVSHLRNTVRFADCASHLVGRAKRILLEVGPGETLLTLLRQDRANFNDLPKITSLRSAHSTQEDYLHWLESVGRLWLAGGRPRWANLHHAYKPQRISLPTYPFERQRYWIEAPTSAHANSSTTQTRRIDSKNTTLAKQSDIADWFYVPSWKRLLPTTLETGTPLEKGHVWLLLTHEGSKLALDLSAKMRALGRVIEVYPGDEFEQLDENQYRLTPGSREHWSALLQGLLGAGLWPKRVVHTWTLWLNATSDAELQSSSSLTDDLNRGFFSIMSFAQAIGDASSVRTVDCRIITSGSCSVAGERVTNLSVAPLASLCRVVPLEYPNIHCELVDIATTIDGSIDTACTLQLGREIVTNPENRVLALRPHARWQECYEPVRFESDIPRNLHLVQGGVYLITGGLGGFGLVFAEYLARTLQAHLILTSRSPFIPEGEWDAVLADEATSLPVRERIQSLKRISVLGGKVTIAVADSADTARMHELLSDCRANFGSVRGIIHAAGLPSFSMIQVKSQSDALEVLSPKVQGVRWIEGYLGDPELDFVLLCSSISAVVPSYGLSDYAAANAYLDAFAAAYDRRWRTRIVSVNWDTWSEVGMAVELAKISNGPAITVKEAEDVFERILGCPVSQVVVSTRDLPTLLETVAADLGELNDLVDNAEQVRVTTSHPRPTLSQPYVVPIDQIEVTVVEIWQELLGIEKIGRLDNFFELGGHSLLGTQVIARLRTHFGLDLPLRTVFEAATPAELAEILRTTQWTFGSNAPATIGMEREEIEL